MAVEGRNQKALGDIGNLAVGHEVEGNPLRQVACGLSKNPKELILDIDAADVNNELAVLEYVEDTYSFYKLDESETRVHDYIDSQPTKNGEHGMFLAKLGLMNYETVIYCPSMIAASVVYAARHTLNQTSFWYGTLKLHTGFSETQIIECARMLVRYHSEAANNKLKGNLEHAIVRKNHVSRFKHKSIEGSLFTIKNFKVVESSGVYRPVENSLKIIFFPSTTIKSLSEDIVDIPAKEFHFIIPELIESRINNNMILSDVKNLIEAESESKDRVPKELSTEKVLIWNAESQPNRNATLEVNNYSRPNLVLTGHQYNAEFALAIGYFEPFVLPGG
ncbi:G2/mitotic-specific cyclin-1 [Capsicum chinense]|nr:G2/mitotic-specific cyclin-1 [Capsicum chinense]